MGDQGVEVMKAASAADSGRAKAVSKVSKLVQGLITDLGEDVSRDGLLGTPQRVAKALMDAMVGYSSTSSSVIGNAIFHEPLSTRGCGGTVLVRDIDFASTCGETLMPFHGRCHVAYLPAEESVLGLSKLARLVQAYAKRLCTQHDLTEAIQHAVAHHMPCKGVFVQINARHLANAADAGVTVTEACSGCFSESGSLHTKEVRMLLRLGGLEPPATSAQGALPMQHNPSPSASPSPNTPTAPALGNNNTGPGLQPTCSLSEDATIGDESDRMAHTVEQIYNTLLDASGQNDRIAPQAAARFVSILRRQTFGYKHSLQQVIARHEREPPMPPFCAQVCAQEAEPEQEGAALSDSEFCAAEVRPQLRCDILEHSGQAALDTSMFAPSEAATGASTCTASESGSMSSGGGVGGVPGGAPAAPQGFRSSTAGPLSSCDSDCSALAATSAWQTHLGGRAQSCVVQFPPRSGSGIEAGTTAQLWSVKFATQCEHHMLPFYGIMHFALHRGEAAIAQPELSAACVHDIVCLYSCRLQVQERLAQQVAAALHEATGGADVVLVCSAAHMCMVARGVEQHAAETLSTAARGRLEQDAEERSVWVERLLTCVQERD